MNLEKIKENAPKGSEYYHSKLGCMKDVFGKRSKAKLWIDNEWRTFDIWKALPTNEFKNIVYFRSNNEDSN